MTPTPRLRFVERTEYDNKDEFGRYLPEHCSREVKVRVLQQFYASEPNPDLKLGEWRDVPLEEE